MDPNIGTASAWRVFEGLDVMILIGAVVATAATLLRIPMAALIASIAVLVVIVYRLIDMPVDEVQDYTVDPVWGAWLSACVAVVMVAACWVAERSK